MKKVGSLILILLLLSGCSLLHTEKENTYWEITDIELPSDEYMPMDTAVFKADVLNLSNMDKQIRVLVNIADTAWTLIDSKVKLMEIVANSQLTYLDTWTIPEYILTGRYFLSLTIYEVSNAEGSEASSVAIYQSSGEDSFLCYANMEDFHGLDESVWSVTAHRLGRSELDSDNVEITDGQLIITLPADKLSGGEIMLKELQGYGIYEIRMKLPLAPTSITGFFLYKQPDFYHEIDIEVYNDRSGTALLTTYADGSVQNEHTYHLDFDPTAEFHDYRIEYAADQVAFYIDGQFIKSWAEGFTDDEMYLMLNCWYPKWLDGKSVNEAQYLIVEWIKY